MIWYGIGLGFLVTVLPTVMLMQSIERLGASQSAMIASIGPVLTILLAVAFLNETPKYMAMGRLPTEYCRCNDDYIKKEKTETLNSLDLNLS